MALAGSGKRCLPRRLAVSGRRIGPARLGRSFEAFRTAGARCPRFLATVTRRQVTHRRKLIRRLRAA